MGLRSKLPKFDLSKTEDKLKMFILISGLILFVGVGAVTAIQVTMSPQFCSVCHIMTPEMVTWQATSHSNIRCVDCHIPPGTVNLLVHKIGAMKELYEYATGTYPTPLAMHEPIESETCETCHNVETRNFTVSGDIIIPHDKHMNTEKAEVFCVSCHAGVAHGKIASRGVIVEGDSKALHGGDLKAWTADDGKQQTARQYSKADMDDCIKCHMAVNEELEKKGSSEKVSIKCEACHKAIKTPDNHSPKESWLAVHGKDAEKNVSSCKSCHNYGMDVQNVTHESKAAAYAWGNEYCVKCHSQLPQDHKDGVLVNGSKVSWRKAHKAVVAEKSLNNCAACHKLAGSKATGTPPASTTCDRCH